MKDLFKDDMDPTEVALKETLILKAKALFFQYMPIAQIARQLEMKPKELNLLAYGNGSNEEMTWRYERLMYSQQEYIELADRNRLLINDSAARVLNMVQKSITIREKKKDKEGEFVPLSATEMDAFSMTILKLDRIVPVERFTVVEQHQTVTPMQDVGPAAHEGALNMGRVIEALRKDKTMLKRLGFSQGDESGRNQQSEESGRGQLQTSIADDGTDHVLRKSGSGTIEEVREHSHSTRTTIVDGARPELSEQHVSREVDKSIAERDSRRKSKTRVSSATGNESEATSNRGTDIRAAEPAPRFDSNGIAVRSTPQSFDSSRVATVRDTKSIHRDEGILESPGESGAGESTSENEWALPEGSFKDAIADEYT